jgi:protein SCO1
VDETGTTDNGSDPTSVDGPTTVASQTPAAQRRRTRTAVLAIGAAMVLLAGVAFLGSRVVADDAEWAGTVLGIAQAKPAVVLHDTDGRPVDLAADTPAEVTLVMFGYTNCPDICPISLATLASALAAMDPNEANKVRLLFVTADPARDTPEVLRTYLDQFDERYVGLTGTLEELDQAQTLANVPPAMRDEPDENGSYAVGHATQMIAYQRDGTARIVYPFGTREGDWLRDLPRLLRGETPTVDE